MIAYGADSPKASTNFAGNKQYFHNDFYEIDSNGKHTPTGNNALSWFFQWAFSMATATIVSGGHVQEGFIDPLTTIPWNTWKCPNPRNNRKGGTASLFVRARALSATLCSGHVVRVFL